MLLRCSTTTMTLWLLTLVGLPAIANAQTAAPPAPQQAQQTPQAQQPPQAEQRTTPVQAPTPTPTQSAPVPLGVNGQLTPWLQVRGEFRTRIEGFTGSGFTEGKDDAYWMDRFRLNATVRPNKSIGFVVQAQDARAFDKTTGSLVAPLRDTLDLRMAYGEFGTTTMVRAGRQELAFGEQRLLGGANWLNTARTFDGGRVTLKRKGVQFDAFAASVVTISPDAFDKSGSGNALYGTYVSLTTLVPKQAVEPYFFWRQSRGVAAELGGTADIHQATTGVRMAGKLSPSVDYSTEVAVQTGSVGPDSIKAWGGHALAGKTLASTSWKPRVFGEYNYASGDANKADGTRGTFDQLYATAHDKYGLTDQVGWKNVHDARVGLEVKPTSKLQLSGGYHSWWLASATDALYNASGTSVARSATGAAGRHIGQEVSAQMAFVYSPQLQISGGYAYLIPGQFLKNTTPGHAYSYPFAMVTYVFLGEQPAIGGRRAQ